MPGNYMTELLRAVPISPDDSNVYYGAGVGIYKSGPFGPVYGHGGWVPGYSSSLRYYPDHEVTVAFQINTDVGIVDDTTAVVSEMEERLAQIAISANNAIHTEGNSVAVCPTGESSVAKLANGSPNYSNEVCSNHSGTWHRSLGCMIAGLGSSCR